MPVNPTYPGVYIDELASPVRTITPVPTAITAFVGPAKRGPVDVARRITSLGDFQRVYGGLWSKSPLSYAVTHFYQNGGSDAIVVRIVNGATPSEIDLGNGVKLVARYPGAWGANLRARVDQDTKDPSDTSLYNLTVRDVETGQEESFRNVSSDPAKSPPLSLVLQASRLVATAAGSDDAQVPTVHAPVGPGKNPFALDPKTGDPVFAGAFTAATDGNDGETVTDEQYVGNPTLKTGMYALLDTDIFNILCLPPPTFDGDLVEGTWGTAATLCHDRRAMLIVDAPAAWTDLDAAVQGGSAPIVAGEAAKNAAIYFPRVKMEDPLQGNRLVDFVPSGAVAGIYAATDARSGVWKAPAGIDTGLNGVRDLSVRLTDPEHGQLNPIGVNCIRSFRVIGPVVWGARTMRGADAFADQWKYVPVRRLALFIEESLYRGTQWAVFMPNDEPLWASLRLNIGAFMNTLYRQGAFQGRSPRDAYLVKCDKENNPQNDIDRGIVNILVGFAPLKPAEFVIIHIQQLAGQLQV